MSLAMVDLPSDPDELRAFAQALQAQHAATAAELASTAAELLATKATIQLTALEIEQLELGLEELETVEAEATSASADADVAPPARDKRRPKRLPLPDHLPRHEVVPAVPHADGCGACGGTMSALGEDVSEVLEYVPGRFQVGRHVRPKLACQRCDAITQAPSPALPIPRGKAGPGPARSCAGVEVCRPPALVPAGKDQRPRGRRARPLDHGRMGRPGQLAVPAAGRPYPCLCVRGRQDPHRRHASSGAGAWHRQDQDRQALGLCP